MVQKLIHFDLMWQQYPNPGGSADQAKASIGGEVNADWINNTCVIRISRSFNYSGHSIPADFAGLNTVVGGDGLHYAFRVKEFRQYLTEVYGQPAISYQYPKARPGRDPKIHGLIPSEFEGHQGVICFVVPGWRDATGHIDLWNGESCIHSAYFSRASDVYLWEVSDSAASIDYSTPPSSQPQYSIAAAVGYEGANQAEDVKTVQTLLLANHVDPNGIDGVCGPKTIAAIREFQARFLTAPDGRVDVDGRTWRALNKL
ncbi:MAG: hypothetical protein F6K19_28125 [Cyanothece sp. SIO1E1]|nr:hypothetical protein [Cyanothece sp. SIO1E1]